MYKTYIIAIKLFITLFNFKTVREYTQIYTQYKGVRNSQYQTLTKRLYILKYISKENKIFVTKV